MEEKKYFKQVCVIHYEKIVTRTNEYIEFLKKELAEMSKDLDVRTEFIGIVDCNGKNYDSLLFYIHDDDISKFCIPRFQYGVRWFEDVISNNPNIYPKEIEEKYWSWESEDKNE